MKKQIGFTLIELVIVIVILGILAAVVTPKFVDLSSDAEASALKAVAGAINSASAVNYATRSAIATKGNATAGRTCQGAASVILQGGIPAGYTLDNSGGNLLTAGSSKNCPVTQTSTGNPILTVNIMGIN